MRRALLLSLLLALPAVPARADPIIFITGGALDIVPGNLGLGTMNIQGTRGFRLSAVVEIQSGFGVCVPCTPGFPTPLGGAFSEIFDGRAVINGQTFQFPSFQADAGLFFFAPSIKTPPASAQAVLSAPFEFRSSFVVYDSEGLPTFFPLVGQGRATVHLVGSPLSAPEAWVFDHNRYEFEAVATPEPGTIVLLGSGLAGLVVRARRRRTQLKSTAGV